MENGIEEKIHKRLDTEKEITISLVKGWVKGILKSYQEPTRAGTPKGDPIGLSKKKLASALLMTLYPNSLAIKDIAEIVKTTEGVIRVWMTQDAHKKAIQDGHVSFSRVVSDTIDTLLFEDEKEKEEALKKLAEEYQKLFPDRKTERTAYKRQIPQLKRFKGYPFMVGENPITATQFIKDDLKEYFYEEDKVDKYEQARLLITIILWTNAEIIRNILKSINENIKKGYGDYYLLYKYFLDCAAKNSVKSTLKFMKDPKNIEIFKTQIEVQLHFLLLSSQGMSLEEKEKEVVSFTRLISDYLEVLVT